VFLSLGSGNCDVEIRMALLLRERGMTDFVIECLELSPQMLLRGAESAKAAGVGANLAFVEGDFNRWRAARQYATIAAHQSLHHVLELEHLFAEVKRGLHPAGYFVTDDMIGRNGHQRWPEALEAMQSFWYELPLKYRWNCMLKRFEEEYANFDCSLEGFEGIRAQDILPLLVRQFDFELFIAFGNIIDAFIDRSFGWNFKLDGEWDRAFIDRVHAFDEQAILGGSLSPTHVFAVMTPAPCAEHRYSRGLSPERCLRKEPHVNRNRRLAITTPALAPQQTGGMSYSMRLAASAGARPYTWLASGLPPGLVLNAEGQLSGTIEADGDFTPLIVVKDGAGSPAAAAQRYTILAANTDEGGPLTAIEPEQPWHGTVGARYSEALLAYGGTPPLRWSLSEGGLPRGLYMDAATGVVAGEPCCTSDTLVSVRVTDSAGQSAAASVKLKIGPPAAHWSRIGVLPHLPCGANWDTSLVLVNPAPEEVTLAVEIHSSDTRHSEWTLFPAPARCSCHRSGHYTLAPHASLSVTLNRGRKDETSGWAEVFATGPVTGHASLRYRTPNGALTEATAPMEVGGGPKLLVPFDNGGGNRAGLALLNLSEVHPDTLICAIWDDGGEFISTERVPLSGRRHTSFMVAERFACTAGRRGTISVRAVSGAPVHAVSLRVGSEGTFALLPRLTI
jgi:SAM-dependent methyltransferase